MYAVKRFGVFFDLRPDQQLSKPSRRRWFETPSRSLWCHRYDETTAQTTVYTLLRFLITLCYIQHRKMPNLDNCLKSHYQFHPKYQWYPIPRPHGRGMGHRWYFEGNWQCNTGTRLWLTVTRCAPPPCAEIFTRRLLFVRKYWNSRSLFHRLNKVQWKW